MHLANRTLAFSVIIHALLLVATVISFKAPNSPKAEKPQVTRVELAEEAPRAPKKVKQRHEKILVAAPDGPKPCEHWYGGIGVYTSLSPSGRMFVTGVYSGYAAFKAGITRGDEIDEMASDPLLGAPGQAIVVVVYRDGIKYVYNVIRSKVCVD